MRIRRAEERDLEELLKIERACFPPAEAAGEASMKERIRTFPETFWVLEEEGKQILGFISGMPSGEEQLTDAMYAGTEGYQKDGAWLMIFGVDVRPREQGKGYGALLMRTMVQDAKKQGRKGVVLLCKERMIPFYRKFGFEEEGRSDSCHGGEVWYSMRRRFPEREGA